MGVDKNRNVPFLFLNNFATVDSLSEMGMHNLLCQHLIRIAVASMGEKNHAAFIDTWQLKTKNQTGKKEKEMARNRMELDFLESGILPSLINSSS